MNWIFWTLGILALAAAGIAGGAYYCYRYVYTVDKSRIDPRKPDTDPQYYPLQERLMAQVDLADGLPYEDVWTRSRDGLKLHGRYYEVEPGAPVQIQFHGYRGSPLRDFCAGLPMALELGCNVLLIDERAHGKSEGKCLTFGVLEREDCLCWVDFIRQRCGQDTPVVIYGVSMGAATVMMAAKLVPENVRGIIADCGYDSPKNILIEVMSGVGFPPKLFYPLIRLGGRLYGGFDVEAASAETALAGSTVPILFIHGEDDRFVPCRMSQRNYAACTAPKTLVTIPGAAHAVSSIVDPVAYRSAMERFLAEIGVLEDPLRTEKDREELRI